MFFGYSRGIKDLDVGYNEFQPEGNFQTAVAGHSSLLPLGGPSPFWAAPTQSSVQAAGADQSKTQATLI